MRVQSLSVWHAMIMINLVQCGTGTVWSWSEESPRHFPGSAALSYAASQSRRHWPSSGIGWNQKLQWNTSTTTPTPLITTDALISASHQMQTTSPLTTRTWSYLSLPQRYLSQSLSPLSACFLHASSSSPTLQYLWGKTTWSTSPPSVNWYVRP